MGLSVATETSVLIQSAPKPYAAPPPPAHDATHKIWSRLAYQLQRYSSSNLWNFRHSRASNSKMSGLIPPKIKLDWALCLSWLPATLMMIRSKMNELAWSNQGTYGPNMNAFWWLVGDILHLSCFNAKLWSNSTNGTKLWTNKHMNGRTERQKLYNPQHKCLGYKKDQIKSIREKVKTPFSPL